MVIANM
jgi:hypothetical protein